MTLLIIYLVKAIDQQLSRAILFKIQIVHGNNLGAPELNPAISKF
jgi:hypothetical protein